MISTRVVARGAMAAALMVLGLHSSAALAEVRYTVTGLGTLGGAGCDAFGINNAGQVVGQATTASGDTHAFLYTPGSGMTDLGTFGGTGSSAQSINNAGQAVGGAQTASGAGHAFVYTPGSGMTDLGTLGQEHSVAWGINNAGQVVGFAYTGINTASPVEHAFLYSDGVMTDLSSLIDPGSGWQLWDATAINDVGQIVGSGIFAGQTEAFLLTPTPEPATLALLAAGAAALVARRRRR